MYVYIYLEKILEYTKTTIRVSLGGKITRDPNVLYVFQYF